MVARNGVDPDYYLITNFQLSDAEFSIIFFRFRYKTSQERETALASKFGQLMGSVIVSDIGSVMGLEFVSVMESI